MFVVLDRVGTHATTITGLDRHSEAALIDVLRGLEDLKSLAAAAQAEATVALVRLREQREAADGVPADRRGRGLAGEAALARRDSSHRGGQHLGLAKALLFELPHTFSALAAGELSEWRATLIARETACLSVADRRAVDAQLHAGDLEGWATRRLIAETQRLTYAADPHAVIDRARRAESERRVSLRPAPDTMTYLTGLRPVAAGVACYAALDTHAKTLKASGDERSRGQLMADTLLARLTGAETTDDLPIGVQLNLTDRTLLHGGSEPAHLDGYGIVPAQWARDLIRRALEHDTAVWIQRLYTHPATGALIAMSSRSRDVPAGLAALIATRDRTCRTPYCDAPIRHTDHVWAISDGGASTVANLQGLCEACNYTKRAAGWRARAATGLNIRHLVITHAPTGHSYISTARDPPGHQHSRAETYQQAGGGSTVEYESQHSDTGEDASTGSRARQAGVVPASRSATRRRSETVSRGKNTWTSGPIAIA